MYSVLLFTLFFGSISTAFTYLAPRTVRPYRSGPPSSLIRRGTGGIQLVQTSGVDHHNSSSQDSSGTGALPNESLQINQSSTDTLSASSSIYEAVCGTRTRTMYGEEEEAYFDFPDFCLLWDDTCSGNKSLAECMYDGTFFFFIYIAF